ncbi:MAG TPA: IS66 family transposase [Methylomirabilota bacterium]
MSRPRRKKPPPRTTPPRIELRFDELGAIVERARQAALSPEDHAKLKAAMDTLAFVTAELEAKRTSLDRLRRWLFGAPTETTRTIVRPDALAGAPAAAAGAGAESGSSGPRPPRPGHGRLSAAAYTGADRVTIPHPSLQRGDRCPGCPTGKIYPLAEPATLVRITGMAPLSATVYACERWRCNLCGEVFTAPAPAEVGDAKYDATATSMVGLLKYGCGLPFHRIEVLQRGMRIPLPAATQWELVRDALPPLVPAWDELLRQAAQGEVLYNDDTTMKILALSAEQRRAAAADEETDARTGVFTSGIVATRDGHFIALFFTGRQHAGENLAIILAQRATDLAPPIQMADALAANTAGDFDTLLASCLAHARRRFVDVVENFPAEVRRVLETLREVYRTDALAREGALSAAERLRVHQTESGPRMVDLETWLCQQLDEHQVEPNSGLGTAIAYMLKHWAQLTLFLRVPGAPLDNNVCERALKKAILHRKNALFYKSLAGARVGDVFMSLIHTAELNGIAPFEYLVALQRHHQAVALDPSEWLPWNYETTLAELQARAGPPR